VDEQLLTFARVLACGGFFAFVGALFGGFVGHLSWKRGRPAGSVAGLSVARAMARMAGQEGTPGSTGALVGAVDGFLFLGLSGVALGLFAAKSHMGWAVLNRLAFGFLVLSGGAVFFGGLAVGISYAGVRAIAGVFAGGMLGAASGGLVGHGDGIVFGAVGGMAAGTILSLFRRVRR
jgi:hypothetical protein